MGTLEDLRSTLDGELLTPGEPGYDDARRIHNGLIDKRPRLIARCTTGSICISKCPHCRPAN